MNTAFMNIDASGTTVAGPYTTNVEDEAGPSIIMQEEEVIAHTASDDETVAQIMLKLNRPTGGIRISEPAQ